MDTAPQTGVGKGGGGDRPGALERTPALIKKSVRALPPPPDRLILLDGANDDDKEDPVALALHYRGIYPDDRFDPYFDLFIYQRPFKEERLQAWMKFPLKLHDAGLVAAADSIIRWGPGLSGRYVDVTGEIDRILDVHPGPIACLRVDSSAFPAPERLRRWIDILTAREVQEVILLNLTRPEDMEAPLQHLRSRRLTFLAIGFVNIRACLRHAMEAAYLDGHAWSSLKYLTLTACAFDGSDLSQTVHDLQGLKTLTIRSCPLTEACNEDGLLIASPSLVALQFYSCTADHKVTIGQAPALTRLTLGVVPAPKAAAARPPPLVQINIMFCSILNTVDQVDMHQQNIVIRSEYMMRVSRQQVLILPFVRTLGVAVELATAHHALDLLSLLRWMPNLKDLTLRVCSLSICHVSLLDPSELIHQSICNVLCAACRQGHWQRRVPRHRLSPLPSAHPGAPQDAAIQRRECRDNLCVGGSCCQPLPRFTDGGAAPTHDASASTG
uniref:F-box/LRR-repeat protein 15/At3g58940/PEG3-like LRR domain-containing protein n=1 Tax=Setaria italica TaxID=4555 RepID=K3ZNN5_SETIT